MNAPQPPRKAATEILTHENHRQNTARLRFGRHNRTACCARSFDSRPCHRCCWCPQPCSCPAFAPVLEEAS